jgi:hypothetical protein
MIPPPAPRLYPRGTTPAMIPANAVGISVDEWYRRGLQIAPVDAAELAAYHRRQAAEAAKQTARPRRQSR